MIITKCPINNYINYLQFGNNGWKCQYTQRLLWRNIFWQCSIMLRKY